MRKFTRSGNAREAGRYLASLLALHPAYRRLWEDKVAIKRDDQLSQAAVARVLAEYLWDIGERHDRDWGLPRDLKDRVTRALGGEVLSPETLRWFIGAFRINEEDAERLWFLFHQGQDSRLVRRTLAPQATGSAGVRASGHRTVSLYDFCFVRSTPQESRCRTMQVVRALEDGVERVSVCSGLSTDTVSVVRGGVLEQRHRPTTTLFVFDIRLPQRISKGETAAIEYEARVSQPEESGDCFRRVVFERLQNVTIVVQFGGHRLPRRVSWAIWDRLDGPPIYDREVAIDADHTVHRHLESVEEAIFGFCWTW